MLLEEGTGPCLLHKTELMRLPLMNDRVLRQEGCAQKLGLCFCMAVAWKGRQYAAF